MPLKVAGRKDIDWDIQSYYFFGVLTLAPSQILSWF